MLDPAVSARPSSRPAASAAPWLKAISDEKPVSITARITAPSTVTSAVRAVPLRLTATARKAGETT
ncbi:hypothetical protein D3C78_1874550 [compost metagenome]